METRKMLLFAITITLVIICYAAFSVISYDTYFDTRPVMAYGISIVAALVATVMWLYLIRTYDKKTDIFVVNVIWDVVVSLITILVPLFMYNVKMDMKTLIGAILAIVGVLITKL
jgi:drug/metabolite transporter (DMT)-like permease